MKKFLSIFSVLFLVSCSDNSLDVSSKESFLLSYNSIINSYLDEDQGEMKAQAFSKALYRYLYPVSFSPPLDNFDPNIPLNLVVDRENEPKVGSQEYLDAISNDRRYKAEFMSPSTIVLRYVSKDSSALSNQEGWIKSWRNKTRVSYDKSVFEYNRSKELISKISPKNVRFSFAYKSGKKSPLINFNIFNPLDVKIKSIDFSADLFGDGKLLASDKFSFSPLVQLSPKTETLISVDVSKSNDFYNIDPKNYNSLNLKVSIDNVMLYNGNYLIDKLPIDEQRFADQKFAVADLQVRLSDAQENLSKYRVAFSD